MNLDVAVASLVAANLRVFDDFDIVRALSENPPNIPSHATYAVQWWGAKRRDHIESAEQDFVLDFVETSASVQWTAAHDDGGFRFVSTKLAPRPEDVAYLGFERNGVFHP
ncbi:MAG TPA: hypothetical protein VF190_05190 [Rhodothermales bacterium]